MTTPTLAEKLAEVLPCKWPHWQQVSHGCICGNCSIRPAILALIEAVQREASDQTWEHAISIVGDGCEGDLDFAIVKMRKIREEPQP